jgi:cation diffusion facilitator family transporter
MSSDTNRPETLAGFTAMFLIGIGIVQIILGEFYSRSVALTANGIDCVGDGFVSSVVWFGLRFFSRPADHKFHYGYYKLENYALGLAAIVMIALAGYIVYRSYNQYVDPHELELPLLGAAVAFIAGAVAMILGVIKYVRHKNSNLQSARLEAFNTIKDGTASFMAVAAIIIAGYGYPIADAIVGFIIAGIIISIAFSALKESSYILLDACDGTCIDSREVIRTLAEDHPDVTKAHIVRLRRTGPVVQGELEIVLPADMTINDLDRIKEELHRDLETKMPNIERLVITAISDKKTD